LQISFILFRLEPDFPSDQSLQYSQYSLGPCFSSFFSMRSFLLITNLAESPFNFHSAVYLTRTSLGQFLVEKLASLMLLQQKLVKILVNLQRCVNYGFLKNLVINDTVKWASMVPEKVVIWKRCLIKLRFWLVVEESNLL
jgi:hypothetical protein